MSFLTLGIRVNPSQYQRIKLENIDFNNKIENLKVEASKKINIPQQGLGKKFFIIQYNFNKEFFRIDLLWQYFG